MLSHPPFWVNNIGLWGDWICAFANFGKFPQSYKTY